MRRKELFDHLTSEIKRITDSTELTQPMVSQILRESLEKFNNIEIDEEVDINTIKYIHDRLSKMRVLIVNEINGLAKNESNYMEENNWIMSKLTLLQLRTCLGLGL